MHNISLEPAKKKQYLSMDSFWILRISWLKLLLIFQFSFLFFQCGLDVEDPTPPSPPVWVQKSLPEEWPERGIDACEGGGIQLEWESLSPLEGITNVQIFRAEYFGMSDSLGEFELLAEINTESMDVVEYQDYSARVRVRYFYKLRVIDLSNNSSLFSDSLTFMLLPPVALHAMSPNGVSSVIDADRRLVWYYNLAIEMEEYCLTIIDEQERFIYRKLFQPSSYDGGAEELALPSELILLSGNIYNWRIDVGANYTDCHETTGSESQWATFVYAGE
jgi:hypothetical protein